MFCHVIRTIIFLFLNKASHYCKYIRVELFFGSVAIEDCRGMLVGDYVI